MQKLPISLLKPGMKVARTVYNTDGQVLLAAGMMLNVKFISRLRMLGIISVYVEDSLMGGVEVYDVIAEDTRLQARKAIKRLHSEASRAVRSGNEPVIDDEQVSETINNIIEDLLSSDDLIVNLSDIRVADDYTFAHSVNTCVLALLTGVSLGFSKSRLHTLGLGTILHDIGKIKVPSEILNKPGNFSQEEYKEIQKHPLYGFEMLRKNQSISLTAAHVAYEHHERYNGEGYPRGLKGNHIHIFARIAGMVDVFDALVSDRVYRKGYLPHDAIEMITGSGNYYFDYDIVKAFIKNVAAYPVGTIVELSTGELAIVIRTPRGCSHRPDVRTFVLKDGIPKITGEISLSSETRILIKRVISEEEYQSAQGMELAANTAGI
ncbi:MAG: HD-GYP domain-containing protein [Bacillota bacterium]|jgi:HD-GYP domain-containing protein (c-di-GMP phosphodiesterase class II)